MRRPTSNKATERGFAPKPAPITGYDASPSRTKGTPLVVPRTVRNHDLRVLTSLPAGKMVPLAAIPLLREDSVTRCNIRASFEMMETAEVLMNAVNVRMMAYLVPNLAFERFQNSIDLLNRSYEGVPFGNDPVVAFVDTSVLPTGGAGALPILKYMGKHGREGQTVNLQYLQAYNEIWNFRAKNRSPDIPLRQTWESSLAPAFWQHQGFAHIVPDFDQAAIDGEVPLNIISGMLPLRGMGFNQGITGAPVANQGVRESDGRLVTYPYSYNANNAAPNNLIIKALSSSGPGNIPDVWAEMIDNNITVSLANIELAKKTQAFAELRRQYTGHSDDYIIDLLMGGIAIPDQYMAQPVLIQDRNTIFGMSKRYATDSANLTESVVNGATFIDMSFSVPRVGVGGVIMLVAEVTPEQLFERQRDPYMFALNAEYFPQFLRDTLDPEKVSVVYNENVDLDHDTPVGVFGYEPLNATWNHTAPCIGGRFYRPQVDAAFDEDRQRIWAVETQNPTLSADFYLCTNMHTKPFVVTDQDPFEVVVRGNATILGNTVFGKLLIEASDDYEQVMSEAPLETIIKPAEAEAKAEEGSEE